MHRRSFVYMVLLLVFSLLLFGCGKESAPSATTPATPSATATPSTSPATPTPTTPPAAAETPAETPAAAAVPLLDDHVASVNGTPMTSSELDQATMAVLTQYQNLYSQFGIDFEMMRTGARGRLMDLEIEVEALARLVSQVLVDAEVERRGVTVTDEEADAEFERQYAAFLETQGMTEETLTSALAAQNMTLDAFKQTARNSIRDQLVMQALQRAVAGPIKLSDDELQAYWFENRAQYDEEAQVRASHILVKTEEEANQVLKDLAAGADFATLARERSTDTGSAQNGGDLGWFGRGQMVGPFEDAAFSLEVGALSGAVKTDYGYHIIWVAERKPEVRHTFEEVSDKVRADVEQEKIVEGATAWYKDTLAAATITVKDPMLSAGWSKSQDLDLGLAAFERLHSEGTVSDPYLPYIIGSIYETKRNNLTTEKTSLEAEDASPERDAQIAKLATEIETLRGKALSYYQETLTALPDDTSILSRIDALAPQTDSEDVSGTP